MAIRKAHRRIVQIAGLDPDIILHPVQAGFDLPTVQKVSGHEALAMVARYAHAKEVHIDSVMEKLKQRIGSTNPAHPCWITPKIHQPFQSR